MTAVLAFVLPIVGIWLVANVLGWLSIRDAGPRPWSWRVLVWPGTYYRWIDEQQRRGVLQPDGCIT